MISSFELFGKTIPLYGVFCSLGLAAAIVVAIFMAKKRNLEFFNFVLVAVVTLMGAFIGAKLLFFIVSWEQVSLLFKTYPFFEALQKSMEGGFVFYGGFIGGVIALFVTLKIQKEDFFNIMHYLRLLT